MTGTVPRGMFRRLAAFVLTGARQLPRIVYPCELVGETGAAGRDQEEKAQCHRRAIERGRLPRRSLSGAPDSGANLRPWLLRASGQGANVSTWRT